MSYAQAIAALYARVPAGRKLGLERMQAACDRAGNPERTFEAVHVAGTNGKGTTSAFTASMLRASGVKVGLYTSPHLVNFSERIQIGAAPIAHDDLAPILQGVLDREPELTFFEAATLAAFLAFRDAGVQTAVLEVGLGGRFDATNVIPPPRVAAITRISFDHMAELGDTLAAIAAEKAGIIKSGSAVALGKLHPDARAVIEARAADVGARVLQLSSPEPVPGVSLAYPRCAMVGSNLAVAVTVARELEVPTDAMCAGIESTTWPGRNELLHRNRMDLTLLDCAHNPDGAVSLSHVIESSLLGEVDSRKDIVLVFGALATKSWRAMMQRLDHSTPNRVFVAPPVPGKAVDPAEIAAEWPGEVAADVPTALARARSMVGSRGLVIVTGSCFLVGAARAHLLGLEADPPVDL